MVDETYGLMVQHTMDKIRNVVAGIAGGLGLVGAVYGMYTGDMKVGVSAVLMIQLSQGIRMADLKKEVMSGE